MAMTSTGMRAFRAAATLANVVPAVRIRIRDGERRLFVVTSTQDSPEGPLPSLSLSAFRRAVGQAWCLHRNGTRLRFLGMDADGEPAVDIGLPAGDVVLPGHIYRFHTHDERCLFCFLTELDLHAAERAVSEVLATDDRCDTDAPRGAPTHTARRVGLHADRVTDLVAVYASSRPDDEDAAGRLMNRLLEVCVVGEAIAELEAAGPEARQ